MAQKGAILYRILWDTIIKGEDIMFYHKINGNGNNFLIFDNRSLKLTSQEIREITIRDCNVKTAIGADGTLIVEESEIADFKMRIFNSNGPEGEMCGNGARCIARFAYDIGAAQKNMSFETLAGIMKAEIIGEEVSIDMGQIHMNHVALNKVIDCNGRFITYHFITVGVPHAIVYCKENGIKSIEEMHEIGALMDKNHTVFPEGTNVNFVNLMDEHHIEATTYERGVDNLTDSCGTGSSASAVLTSLLYGAKSPVTVKNPGGINTINFELMQEGQLCHVQLQGLVKYCAKIEMVNGYSK